MNLKAERKKLIRRAFAADKKLGAELRALRVSRGIKACWVADQMKFKPSYIFALETGTRHWRPVLEQAYRKAIA